MAGMCIANTLAMKQSHFVFVGFLLLTSCARKVEVRAPEIIHTERYSYVRDVEGRLYIVTSGTRDFDEAIRKIHPGPASVDKLDLWVITPLQPAKKEPR
jgi:hypothetical protein